MDDDVKQKITTFFAQFPLKQFAKGQMLVHAGENPPGIFYILSGQVRQYDISDQGNEVVVNVFKEPAFFPMSWATTGTPNRYFFAAATDLTVHIAPAAKTVAFLKGHPDVTFDLLTRLYSGVEGLQRRMAHLMGGSAQTRVTFELGVAGKRFGMMQPDGSCKLDINEEELARRSGMTRETINRELSALKRQELIAVDHGHIVITSLARLEATLGERL